MVVWCDNIINYVYEMSWNMWWFDGCTYDW